MKRLVSIVLLGLLSLQANAQSIVYEQPHNGSATCTFGGSSFLASATGTLPLQHVWQAELDPGVWTDLADGNLIHNGIVLGVVGGATSDWMSIDTVTHFLEDRPALNIRCSVSNDCGSVISEIATLTVWPTATGDVNLDGAVNALDIQAFIGNVMTGWVDDSEVPALVAMLLAP